MKIVLSPGGEALTTRTLYRLDDLAFDVEQRNVRAEWSISLGTLQLDCDSEGRILHLWGYAPPHAWASAALHVPDAPSGRAVVADLIGERGVSYEALPGRQWRVRIDVDTDWICIGEPAAHGTEAVEVSTDLRILTREAALHAVWVRPVVAGVIDQRQLQHLQDPVRKWAQGDARTYR